MVADPQPRDASRSSPLVGSKPRGSKNMYLNFGQFAPDHSAYLNRSNMYDLDGLNVGPVQRTPKVEAVNLFPEAMEVHHTASLF